MRVPIFIKIALLLIISASQIAQAQLGIADMDGEKLRVAELAQVQKIQRQDDARLSAFFRLWMFYVNDKQYVANAPQIISRATHIMDGIRLNLMCGDSPSEACLKFAGCKIGAPYLPTSRCPSHFRFDLAANGSLQIKGSASRTAEEAYWRKQLAQGDQSSFNRKLYSNALTSEFSADVEGTYNNVFLDSLAYPIDVRRRRVPMSSSSLPYLINPDDLVYYGSPSLDEPRLPYLLAADLLAQYWTANPAARNNLWNQYYKDNLSDYNAVAKQSFENFVQLASRKWVETKYNISLVDSSSDYSQRINRYLKHLVDPQTLTVEIGHHNEVNSDGLDPLKGFEVASRFVDFKMASTRFHEPLPFTFDCQNQFFEGIIYQLPACNFQRFIFDPATHRTLGEPDPRINQRSAVMTKIVKEEFFRDGNTYRDVGIQAGIFVLTGGLISAAERVIGLSAAAEISESAYVSKRMIYGLVDKGSGKVMTEVAQLGQWAGKWGWRKWILQAGLSGILGWSWDNYLFDPVRNAIDPNGMMKIKNGAEVIRATRDFEIAVNDGQLSTIKAAQLEMKNSMLNFMTQGNYSERNVSLRAYSKDRYQFIRP